ncbi:MAG: 4-alpha-glucanotransferase, partial [Gammaproteobacteria bacterium]
MEDVFGRRRAGVLLHPTSLPSGELGEDAFLFSDFLERSGASVWQTLPLGPPQNGGSPYQCLSVHAGNPALISLEALRSAGWLEASPEGERSGLLALAREGFERRASPQEREAFRSFEESHAYWLEDYALFVALKRHHGGKPWAEWPQPLRDRHPEALDEARRTFAGDIAQVKFEQFAFFSQWQGVKGDANGRGILMFGDMPIFVAWDSADVWVHRDYFQLDERGYPTVVAGVPPDYFSSTGQRWGNPLYDWERMEADGFSWWIERVRTQLELFDLIRVDHFRGFEAYWAIPASESTAVHGQWVKAPGDALFKALLAHFGRLPLVAEDLGIITPEVEALRDRYAIPGMKVLQFAFEGGADNPYLPHNHIIRCVVYTGTHDNDT